MIMDFAILSNKPMALCGSALFLIVENRIDVLPQIALRRRNYQAIRRLKSQQRLRSLTAEASVSVAAGLT